jgi:phosphate starvation-inducible protein PhoH and related proteins
LAFLITTFREKNSTPNQMLILLTRVGENYKLIITGDINQSDRCNNNGLVDLMLKLKNVEMNNNDIQRSKIVSNIIKLYNI